MAIAETSLISSDMYIFVFLFGFCVVFADLRDVQQVINVCTQHYV